MDASGVYGSYVQDTRELVGDAYPYLRTGQGDLPCPIDTCDVPMANPFQTVERYIFAYGDFRGNENPGLSSIHSMWVNRHNQWVNKYKLRHGYVSGDRLFEMARARVIAEIQQTSKEYVESLVGVLPKYDPSKAEYGKVVTIFAEFSHCINRFQHSQLRGDMRVEFNDGIFTQ